MSFLIRTAALSVLLAPITGIALAQEPAATNSAAGTPASGAASAATGYRSVFDGYRGYSDQPVQSWRETNDLVGRIGGWQTYAREAQGGAATGSTSAPAAPASGAHRGGHSGRRTP